MNQVLSYLQNVSIKKKLILMISIPIFWLIYFATDIATDKLEIAKKMENLQHLSVFFVNTSKLVHTLQVERGITVGYLASNQQKFIESLQKRRTQTDKMLDNLHQQLKEGKLIFISSSPVLINIIKKLDDLMVQRIAISAGDIGAAEAMQNYSLLIEHIIDAIRGLSKLLLSHNKVAHHIRAYINLMYAKEFIGIERAMLQRTFIQRVLRPSSYQELVFIAAKQEIYLNNFLFHATPAQKNIYQQQLDSQLFKEVIGIRDKLLKDRRNYLTPRVIPAVKPEHWWRVSTEKINALQKIELKLASDLQDAAINLKNKAKGLFAVYIVIIVIVLFTTLLLSYFVARVIIIPLKSLMGFTQQIANGQRDITIKTEAKDEIGQLARTLYDMLYSINHFEALQAKEISERRQAETTLKHTNSAYQRFVPNEFLHLLEKKDILGIDMGDNVEMDMTIQFLDIRAFTTLSEHMSPQENFNFINEYLSHMGPIIRQYHGFIDKYIGDAIMALYVNADDAVNASIAMLKELEVFNQRRIKQKKPPIHIGIGLNTGRLMLGIIGEKHRLQGTVISDAVNLAARIESSTKTYKCPLIISKNTYENLYSVEKYDIRFIDDIKVKGRSEHIYIYDVFDGDHHEQRQIKKSTLHLFNRALDFYRNQQFLAAKKLFQEYLTYNNQDYAAILYLQRCHNFLELNSSNDWERISKSICWTPDLSVKNVVIDEQHQALFKHTHDLVMSIGSGRNREEVSEIIAFLESYVVSHFETEEYFMKKYNYPQINQHKTEHARFIEIFTQLKQNYQREGGHLYLALQIQQQVVTWLLNHIAQSDKVLGEFLKEKQITEPLPH